MDIQSRIGRSLRVGGTGRDWRRRQRQVGGRRRLSLADYLVDNFSVQPQPPPPPGPDPVEKALKLTGDAEEIVFVTRSLGC